MSQREHPDDDAETVLLEVSDGVGVVTLNRPAQLNAVDGRMRAAFPARLEEAADREDVRVIVLAGAGRGFCAGADFSVLSSLGKGEQPALSAPRYLVAKTIAKPVIGVINGPCAGLGMMIALACDLRFASPETKFGTGFAQRGLVAEQGLALLLSDLVGSSRALDLLFTSRVVGGEEALELGMVDYVHPPQSLMDEAMGYARELAASSSAVSMGVMKWQVQRARESSLWQARDDADELTRRAIAGRDFVTIGARVGRDRPGSFRPIPPGRLGEGLPLDLIPPAATPTDRSTA